MHECLFCKSNEHLQYACEQHEENKPTPPWKVKDQNRMKYIDNNWNIWMIFRVERVCGVQ